MPKLFARDGDVRPYSAEADDAEGLVVELDPHELLAVPHAFLEGIVGEGDFAGCGQHDAHGKLGRGKGIARGGVHDDNALLARRFDVDVVEADACPADHLELARALQEYPPGWTCRSG